MKNLFLKLFKGHKKTVPETVQYELTKHFPNAINIEWEVTNHSYEAVFYVGETEYIAKLSVEGILLEYKKNLWPNELPEAIAAKSREGGEIMNSILITRQNTLLYEVIIRDVAYKRKLLLFDDQAILLDTKKL